MASFCHKRVSTPGKVTGCSALGACAGTGGAPAAGVQALAQGPRHGGVCPHTTAQWLSRPQITNESLSSAQSRGQHGSH